MECDDGDVDGCAVTFSLGSGAGTALGTTVGRVDSGVEPGITAGSPAPSRPSQIVRESGPAAEARSLYSPLELEARA